MGVVSGARFRNCERWNETSCKLSRISTFKRMMSGVGSER